MSKLKYVMTKKGDFALFSDQGGLSHADMANAMLEMSPDEITSGGFAKLDNNGIPVHVYGESVSARVTSSDDDAERITHAIERGEAFQLFAEEEVIGMSEIWVLTNSTALENALNERITIQNHGWRQDDPISLVRKENISLAAISQEETVNRYHIPSLW